ncbi:aspartyl/asparaginyl beta-hydroxylase isoform X3, partial [Sigmodon hispidus]
MTEDKEAKHGGHKNGKRGGISGGSFFTWFMVIALLGVWTSVAVVWFDLIDYEEVLGKLGVYDADGDGDFDVDDAKALLEGPGGLAKRKAKAKAKEPGKEELKKERGKAVLSKSEEWNRGKKEDEKKGRKKADSDMSPKASPRGKKDREKEKANSDRSSKSKENSKKAAEVKAVPKSKGNKETECFLLLEEEAEPLAELEKQAPEGREVQDIEDEVKEQFQSLLQESAHTEYVLEADGPTGEPQPEAEDFLTVTDGEDRIEALEPEAVHEAALEVSFEPKDSYHMEETASQDHPNDVEEMMHEQESLETATLISIKGYDLSEAVTEEEATHHDYDEPVYEHSENEGIEISDNVIDDSNRVSEGLGEINVPSVEEQQDTPPD